VPGYVDVHGTANSHATVTLWGDNGGYAATSRKGEYFRGEVAADNGMGAVWVTVTNVAVLRGGNSADIVTNITGRLFVPRTPKPFTYDADGNLLSDGRWNYTCRIKML